MCTFAKLRSYHAGLLVRRPRGCSAHGCNSTSLGRSGNRPMESFEEHPIAAYPPRFLPRQKRVICKRNVARPRQMGGSGSVASPDLVRFNLPPIDQNGEFAGRPVPVGYVEESPRWERSVFTPTFRGSIVRGSTASPGAPSLYNPSGSASRSCGRR